MDCFEIVKLKYNLSYREALDKIIKDAENFTLGDQVDAKEHSKIEFTIGPKEDLSYFHKFGISNKTLEKFKVYPAKAVYKDEKIMIRSKKNDPTFIYLFQSGNIKTYKPLTSNKKDKWGGNSGGGDVQGLEHLPRRGQILFITSSYKDVMCLYEMGYNSIAFNGEGYGLGKGETAKFVENLISKLEKRFEHIVFYLDNDSAGINFAVELAWKFRKKYIYNSLGNPKDPSDYVKKYSLHNGKRKIKRLLSRAFRIQSGFLDYVQSLDNSSGHHNAPFGGSD